MMPQSKPLISIVNVVASATIDQRLDLNDIVKKFPDVEWHPEQFPGAVFRIRSPKTATLIFRTGKMVCTGAKSEEIARKAVKKVVQLLRKGKIKMTVLGSSILWIKPGNCSGSYILLGKLLASCSK